MQDLFKDVVDFLREYAEFDTEKVTMDTRIRSELGLDSLSLITMIDEAERRYNVRIDDDQLAKIKTVKDIVDLIG